MSGTKVPCHVRSATLVWLALLAVLAPCRVAVAQTVDRIEIVRHDVFTGAESRKFYGRLANGLHITTHDAAVRREILIRPGEPYDSALAAEGARNLRRLGVFRRVQVDTATTDSGFVVRYTTDDGWSTKLDFRFGSTGNESTWAVGAYEDNLLGTAGQLAFEHRKTPDRTSDLFLFQRSRLLWNKVFLRADYIDKSDGWFADGLFGVPWLSSRARARVFFNVVGRDERVLRFRDGAPDPVDSVRRVQTVVRGDVGYAPVADAHHYIRLGAALQVRRDDFAPWGGSTEIGKTVYGDLQAWAEISRVRFQVLQGFQTFAHQEDIDIGLSARFGLAATPAAWGHGSTGVGPIARLHAGLPLGLTGFVTGDLLHSAVYRPAGVDSSTTQVGMTAGWLARERHVFVAHIEGGWKTGVVPGEEFDLGLGSGPRAFESHAFTGDRQYFLSGEYRFTADPDMWGLFGFGVALFADHGGAWYDGDPRRSGTDAGFGLRLGPSRATSLSVLRIDLAHRFANHAEKAGWVLVIGKGFTFEDLN